jgi:hypothetical protein
VAGALCALLVPGLRETRAAAADDAVPARTAEPVVV